MRILLTGAAGQLGTELIPLLAAKGSVTSTDRFTPAEPVERWEELDIGDTGKLELLLKRLQPELIVNTAAYTAVDLAETNPQTAFDVNATLPDSLARWARHNDARLIHYSTDYVFDGKSSRPYRETDTPDPQSVYGDSKRAGECAIEASGCKYATLRTSWIYSSHGKNFVLTMLDLARKGISLKVVDDQRGCPTWARNLAMASCSVLENWQRSVNGNSYGLFHYCDDQTISWYEFAHTIFKLAVNSGLLDSEPELSPVPTTEFPQPAERPKSSALDSGRIVEVFKVSPASFKQSLQAVINEIGAR